MALRGVSTMADKDKEGWPGPTSPPPDGDKDDGKGGDAQAWPGPTAPPSDGEAGPASPESDGPDDAA
jgi:hypothetical protein